MISFGKKLTIILVAVIVTLSVSLILVFLTVIQGQFSDQLKEVHRIITAETVHTFDNQLVNLKFALAEVAKKKHIRSFTVDNSATNYEFTYDLLSSEKILTVLFKYSIYDTREKRIFSNDDCELSRLLPLTEILDGKITSYMAYNNKGHCKRVALAVPVNYRGMPEGVLVGTVDITVLFDFIVGSEAKETGASLLFEGDSIVSTPFTSEMYQDTALKLLDGISLRSFIDQSVIVKAKIKVMIVTVLLVLVVLFVMLLILYFYLVPISTRPLRMMLSEILKISNNLNERVLSQSSITEVHEIEVAFNGLLDQLEEAEKENMAKAHKSGVAENAVSVLHNIGNILTAMGMRLDNSRCCTVSERIASLLDKCHGALKSNYDKGTINDYFSSNKGESLLLLMKQLSEDVKNGAASLKHDFHFMQENIQHISAIITIQQNYAASDLNIKTSVKPEEIVYDILRLKEDYIKAHSITVTTNFAPDAIIKVNRNGLAQTITNFIVNGFESSLERLSIDGTSPQLSITTEVVNGLVRLTISDEGMGIGSDKLLEVFKYGYSTKQRGSGFGLHNCSNFVQANGGKVYIESEGVYKGASIIVEFPLYTPSPNT